VKKRDGKGIKMMTNERARVKEWIVSLVKWLACEWRSSLKSFMSHVTITTTTTDTWQMEKCEKAISAREAIAQQQLSNDEWKWRLKKGPTHTQ
jgi:hypothetical protein